VTAARAPAGKSKAQARMIQIELKRRLDTLGPGVHIIG